MHARRARHRYTYREYLDLEATSSTRHEYFDGEIYAMAGGTPEHAMLAAAFISALDRQLGDGDCRVATSDLKVRVLATGLTTYPDVTVLCGPLERDPESTSAVVNPTVLVEVLSDSTEAYDRGEKLEHYLQIPTLQACLLASHREACVELWTRRGEQWQRTEARAGSALRLDAIGCTLDVGAIYQRALGDAAPR